MKKPTVVHLRPSDTPPHGAILCGETDKDARWIGVSRAQLGTGLAWPNGEVLCGACVREALERVEHGPQ